MIYEKYSLQVDKVFFYMKFQKVLLPCTSLPLFFIEMWVSNDYFFIQKVSKKLHLSKSKLAIFSTSGQLTAFYLISIFWGLDVILRERFLPDLSLLWSNYPAPMTFMLKLFLIVQLAYSLHELPELYFQRTKREEYTSKAIKSIASLVLIAVPYFLK